MARSLSQCGSSVGEASSLIPVRISYFLFLIAVSNNGMYCLVAVFKFSDFKSDVNY